MEYKIATTVFIALGLSLVVHLFRKYWRLAHIPGPFWAKFTDLQRVLYIKTGISHEIHQQIHEKQGHLVRLGPNMVSVGDPNAIPVVYPMRPGVPKSKFYDAFMPFSKGGSMPAIFTTQDENQHKQLKNPIASLYSLSNVVTFEKFVDEVLHIFCQQIDERFAGKDKVFDLSDWIQFFAFEVMGTMTFSKRYGFLENGEDMNGMLGTIWNFMLTVAPMTQMPWVDKLLHKNSIAASMQKHSGNNVLAIAANATTERQKQMQEKGSLDEEKSLSDRDFLSRFIELQNKNESTPPWACLAWTFSNVIAGSDSTAVVMRTTVYNILAHQKSFNKIMAELDEVDKKTGLTRPFPAWNEVSELPYLDACVNEAVRLHPPFCLQLERIVPEGGMEVCGQYLPPGTLVGMNPYVVNRHRPTFGEDADEWRPERWLEGDDDHKKKLEQSVMTFGAGRRVCLGKNVALLEIKKTIPALLLNYEFNLLDASDYTVENSYFFRQSGINVKATKRAFA